MAVGLPLKTTYANGDVYSASDVNDTNGTVNLIGQTQNFYAGKNKIINGAFDIWQRGTSITVPIANNSYSGADRFQFSRNGTSSVVTVSRQAFTPGTAPVAGYEGNYFMRFNQTTAGSGGSYNEIITRMENVTTFAGQTVTFSFWAKADSSRTLPTPVFNQNFGSGGSGTVTTNITLNSNALTTSWTRYTGTVSIPSISGKTIGTSSFLEIDMQLFMNTTFTFDTWGWQVESGSTATAFQTATGTIQGELAACQRYCWKVTSDATDKTLAIGTYYGTTTFISTIQFPVTMRTAPSATIVNGTNYWIIYTNATNDTCDTGAIGATSANATNLEFSGNVSGTQGYGGQLRSNNASASIILSAEL